MNEELNRWIAYLNEQRDALYLRYGIADSVEELRAQEELARGKAIE